jgi:hypothetical protein
MSSGGCSAKVERFLLEFAGLPNIHRLSVHHVLYVAAADESIHVAGSSQDVMQSRARQNDDGVFRLDGYICSTTKTSGSLEEGD